MDDAAPGWRELSAILERIIARYQVPANVAKPIVARSMLLFREFDAQMRVNAPRGLGLAAPLSDIESAKLEAFYSAYQVATIKSIMLAVLKVELPGFKPTAGSKLPN